MEIGGRPTRDLLALSIVFILCAYWHRLSRISRVTPLCSWNSAIRSTHGVGHQTPFPGTIAPERLAKQARAPGEDREKMKDCQAHSPKQANRIGGWPRLPLSGPCSIWYIGAHTHGGDGQLLHKLYPCTIHIFEPVGPFVDSLKKVWGAKGLTRVEFHTFGLAAKARRISNVVYDSGDGSSTFSLGESSGGMYGAAPGKKTTDLELRSVADVWQDLQQKGPKGSAVVDFIFMNCEGCEYEVLPALSSANLLPQVKFIQWRPHENFEELPTIPETYCRIESFLKESHRITERDGGVGKRINWERWRVNGGPTSVK
ncbi:unnamed protein product [Amoebophrya sp. A120]|nr:unnamed protein product [Amoebophrya sp. A120]|eukprot:GSA120T00020640001.1